MKIAADIIGRSVGPERVRVDKRWIMAYNAALGEVGDAAHALFPVCYEWPANQLLREATGLQALNERLVHAQHDLTIHRSVQKDEQLVVSGKVVGAVQRRPGALVVLRMEAHGADGGKVSTSDYGMLYRGVALEGGDVGKVEDPPKHSGALESIGEIAVAATAAHVYTECARIWNPIHTDRAYARAAGLPDIILHGTATLALSVSKTMSVHKLFPLKRIRCRFAGMVFMPSTLMVHASRVGDEIAFETREARGGAVIDRGWVE